MGSVKEYLQCAVAEAKTLAFWRDALSEFVATFMLMSVQSALPLTWSVSMSSSIVQVGLGVGFIVATMAWALGDFGGGHMNPAVSLSMALSFDISFLRAGVYIAVQTIGAIAGAGFIYAVTPPSKRGNLAATELGEGVDGWQGMLVELWITCILVLTIRGSTNKQRKGNILMHTLPIGLAVALGIMSGFGHTGGSMNPARSIGPAVVMGIWGDHWVYWVGPFLGGTLATLIYVLLLDKVDKDSTKSSAALAHKSRSRVGVEESA
ncbi:hypothetical protein CAPTEDRAFT_148029 [Capitella teleta]|uniref:Aquaporin n=1 Tax=Capitella teleta TaxID=283909 RepID=R7TCH6_CAPTE|nr:hypothetical protein CAPTEDRAFT_148029 [Capitella teleta]|eukprot:ELT91414.1 hypothetical protein CAPTEDRAFT_148029 [Capitella teleta]